MGILRTDRITGLGGANAITGSTFFGNGNGLGNILSNSSRDIGSSTDTIFSFFSKSSSDTPSSDSFPSLNSSSVWISWSKSLFFLGIHCVAI